MVSSSSCPTTVPRGSQIRVGGSTRDIRSSRITLTKTDLSISAYNRVIDLLAKDPGYQREVALGKRIGFYKLGEELGSGNFSKVKLGAHILTKERVAIKVIEKSKMDQKGQKLLAREIQNMEETHHPNIIRLFEVVETLTKLHLILEYAGGGELYDYVVNNNKLCEDESRLIFAQVLSAVIHMHNLGIIHRDIKAENVFFAGPNRVKLGDFGFSVTIKSGDTLNTFCGSPPYAAPELFKDKTYDGQYVDIWALGILVYFMVTGNTPFKGDTVNELKKQILICQFEIPDSLSGSCQDLIGGILKMEPMERYSLKDIRRHIWTGTVNLPEPYEKCNLVPNEHDLNEKPMIKEVWATMHKYGITKTMMKEAAKRGAKNSIVGTYRILLCQMQTRPLTRDMDEICDATGIDQYATVAVQKKSVTQRTSKLCNIL